MSDSQIRAEALAHIQSADISALLSTIQVVETHLRPLCPDLPALDQEFLRFRKDYVHQILESIESSDPARAAQLQEVIDRHSTHHPFDYD